MSCSLRVFAIIFFAFILSADSLCKAEEGISSGSPGVMNLSGYLRGNRLLFQEYVPIKIDVLDFGAAELMIRAPQRSRNDREIIRWEKLTHKDEKKRIADDKNAVSRAGKSLVIKPESAPPITFKDWYLSGGDQEEDDLESFFYLGKLTLNGFYRVEALYQHDSPGSFFIKPEEWSNTICP